MSVEDKLAEAMRRTAETMDPSVDELVNGGIARGRRRRLRNRATAATAVVAVVATGAGLVTLDEGVEPAPPARLASATEVLGKAAQTVQARPETRPDPRQWLYEKTLESGIGAEHGPRPVTDESWLRLDGVQDAGFRNGKLVVYRHTGREATAGRRYNDRLASLPADPRRLRAAIDRQVANTPAEDRRYPDRDGQVFGTVTQMLWDAPMGVPPKTQAALYRLVATIPGVRVDRNVKDGAGRPAIAVSRGYGEQFLLDPATYQMVAQRTVSNGHNAPVSVTKGVDPGFKVPVGTVTYSLTRLTVKVVDQAGQR